METRIADIGKVETGKKLLKSEYLELLIVEIPFIMLSCSAKSRNRKSETRLWADTIIEGTNCLTANQTNFANYRLSYLHHNNDLITIMTM